MEEEEEIAVVELGAQVELEKLDFFASAGRTRLTTGGTTCCVPGCYNNIKEDRRKAIDISRTNVIIHFFTLKYTHCTFFDRDNFQLTERLHVCGEIVKVGPGSQLIIVECAVATLSEGKSLFFSHIPH